MSNGKEVKREDATSSGNNDGGTGTPNVVVPIVTKQISDVINFQEPTTSKNYSFKTEIRIDILGEPKFNEKSSDSSDNSVTLSLYNDGDVLAKKGNMETEESYATIDNCLKEKTTATNEMTMFSRDQRTQRAIVGNSEAPPPYDSQPPPAYSATPARSGNPYRSTVTSTNPNPGGYPPYDYFNSITFSDISIRHQFIQKVFCILAVQLSITTALVLFVLYHEPSAKFVRTNMAMFWAMVALQLVTYMTLMCYQITRRIFPLNFILLLVFTCSLSYICAALTVFYSTKVVLLTAGSTALICFVIAILACQTWFDITKWSFIIAIASIILSIFGLVVIIVSLVSFSPILWLVYAGLMTFMFCIYLLYDLQCILGGRRQQISPEEYIYAALSLYVDIVMIFMYMLNLVNACSQ